MNINSESSSYFGSRPENLTLGTLFAPWVQPWGLRGDPYLWEDLSNYLSKEPLPASVAQFLAIFENSFVHFVGASLSEPISSVYIERYNHGGISGGYVSFEFWRTTVLQELHRRYLSIKFVDSTALSSNSSVTAPSVGSDSKAKATRMMEKPCRYESYPSGCRFGTTCRFHHSKPVAHFTPFRSQKKQMEALAMSMAVPTTSIGITYPASNSFPVKGLEAPPLTPFMFYPMEEIKVSQDAPNKQSQMLHVARPVWSCSSSALY